MRTFMKRPLIRILAGVSFVALVAMVGYSMYLASIAGELPWQVDPTRIPVTPFADIPGFNVSTVTPDPSAFTTPVPESV